MSEALTSGAFLGGAFASGAGHLLVAAMLVLTAVSGTFVVLTRDPRRQVFAIAANGLVLGLLFLVLQAPDVALSEITVGTALTPLLFLVTLAAVAVNRARQ